MSARLIGIVGLARSGRAAARLALARGERVFASDAADTPQVRAAAEEVRLAGGEAETGGHSIDRLAACDLLVVSPGIPPGSSILSDARLAGVPRVSELEFAFRALAAPVIGVTGTNGKSTTTALAAHLLRAADFDAVAAGNIGLALSEVALRSEPPDWVVVEASSFQLADTDNFAPRIGVLTNLSPDHLDRYESAEHYYADKARIFRNATVASVWVLNGDDARARALPADAPGRRRYFQTERPLPAGEDGGWVTTDGALVLRESDREERLVHVSELRLLGRHNQANALAAALAAAAAGASRTMIASGLRSFEGLEHRLQPVAEAAGILWINDSKATNLDATRTALRSMTRPTVLLLGGRHKGEPYTALLPDLGWVRAVIAYGEAGALVAADLGAHVDVTHISGDFAAVIDGARAIARPGDAVLLSPACASFDMFRDYEQRGAMFRELVRQRVEAGRG